MFLEPRDPNDHGFLAKACDVKNKSFLVFSKSNKEVDAVCDGAMFIEGTISVVDHSGGIQRDLLYVSARFFESF